MDKSFYSLYFYFLKRDKNIEDYVEGKRIYISGGIKSVRFTTFLEFSRSCREPFEKKKGQNCGVDASQKMVWNPFRTACNQHTSLIGTRDLLSAYASHVCQLRKARKLLMI